MEDNNDLGWTTNKNETIKEDTNFDYDELIELYSVSTKIEKDIKELWENTILRYLDFCEEREILKQDLTYSKFYDFMVKENKMYRYVLERIYELENDSK